MTDDTRNLLGGYATGTLSEQERLALFEAALQDQELFEALAGEQAVHDLLQNPSARASVLRATEAPRFSIRSVFAEWLQGTKSKVLVAAGSAALAAIVVSGLRENNSRDREIALRVPMAPMNKPPSAILLAPAQGTPGAGVLELQRKSQTVAARERPAQEPVAQPPSTALERVVSSGEITFAYYLLADRGPNGTFQEISADTPLQDEDHVRLRLHSNQGGYLKVSAGQERVLHEGYITPGDALTIPQAGYLTVGPPDSNVLQVQFTRVAEELTRPVQPRTAAQFQATESAARALNETRAKPAPAPAEANLPRSKPAEGNAALTFEIPLKRKP